MEPAISNDFYKDGFFGYGEKGDFTLWGLDHFIPLIVFGIAIFLLFHFRNKIKNLKWKETLRFVFAAVLLFVEISYFWRLLYVGSGSADKHDLLTKLPIQVCEWSCIFSAFMIMKKSKHLYDICYYTCLVCSVIPLFTPAVISTTGPTYYRYYQFWGEHMLPILAVLYMTFVHGFRPTLKSIYKPVTFLFILAVVGSIANYFIPEADYLYLTGRTQGIPLIKYLPDNIYLKFLILTVGFTVVFIGVYYLTQLVLLLNKKYIEKKSKQAEQNHVS